jgi:hypothetical protein
MQFLAQVYRGIVNRGIILIKSQIKIYSKKNLRSVIITDNPFNFPSTVFVFMNRPFNLRVG